MIDPPLLEIANPLGWDAFYCYESPAPNTHMSVTPMALDTGMRIYGYNDIEEEGTTGTTLLGNPFFKEFTPSEREINSRPDGEYVINGLKIPKPQHAIEVGWEPHTILGSGGQTYDVISQQPLTASQAYHSFRDMLSYNEIELGGRSILHFLRACFVAYKREELTLRIPTTKGTEFEVISGAELYRRATKAEPIVKQGERAKPDCRAIVELSIPFKCAQALLERFCAQLNMQMSHSTAEVGGYEKQNILEHLSTQAQFHHSQGKMVCVCCGDSTKWNEAHNMINFALIIMGLAGHHQTDQEVKTLLFAIAQWRHKSLGLGKGFRIMKNGVPKYYQVGEFYKLVRDEGINPGPYLDYYNFIKAYERYFDFDHNTLEVPSGMMMGTMNHMSSTVFDVAWSAVTAHFQINYQIDVYAAISSDDYVAWMIFSGERWKDNNPTKEQLSDYWTEAEFLIRQFAINPSLKKNMYCLFPTFEYTSQIHTAEGFISYIGQEIGSLFAPGISVAVDLQVLNKTCANIQQKGCGTVTACVAMQTGVNFIRALHGIDAHHQNPRSKLGKEVKRLLEEWREQGRGMNKEDLMICHGGKSPWISTNLGIPEAALKDTSRWQDFYRINVFTQDNPFLNAGESTVETTDRGRRMQVYNSYAKTCDATTPVLNKNVLNDKRFTEYLDQRRCLSSIGQLCAEIACYIKRDSNESLWDLLNRTIADMTAISGRGVTVWEGDVRRDKSSGESSSSN